MNKYQSLFLCVLLCVLCYVWWRVAVSKFGSEPQDQFITVDESTSAVAFTSLSGDLYELTALVYNDAPNVPCFYELYINNDLNPEHYSMVFLEGESGDVAEGKFPDQGVFTAAQNNTRFIYVQGGTAALIKMTIALMPDGHVRVLYHAARMCGNYDNLRSVVLMGNLYTVGKVSDLESIHIVARRYIDLEIKPQIGEDSHFILKEVK